MPKFLRISSILVLLGAAACDAAGPAENDLGKIPAGGGGVGEEVAGEPLIEPSAAPEEVEDPAVQIARSEAANKRLEALRKKQKKLSAEAFWESAEAANKQQHWKEAREAYQGLAIHHPRSEKAVVAAQRSALASFRLGEYGEGLLFLEDALELFRGTPDEARLLRVLGNIHLAIPHWGVKKGGELLRGRWDQGIYQDTHKMDRKLAIRFLEKARAFYETKPELLSERLDTQLELVGALARFTPLDSAWSSWYYAWSEAEEDDRVDEEGADEHAGEYWAQTKLQRAEPRGMPVDAEGNIVFTQRPEKYAGNLNDTAKIKFLLHEITRLDESKNKELAAQAIYRQALLFRARDGSERLQRLQNWWWNGVNPYKADIEAKKVWELADDEVLGLIATHIGVYKVPADENSLRLFERIIEEYPKSAAAERAKLSIGAFYQSRAQYDKAIAAYEKFLRENPDSKERGTAESMLQQIRRGEVKIGDTGAQAAGSPAVLPLEHRNLTALKGRARPLDMKKMIARFKEGWTRDGEPRYDVYPESPNNLFINSDEATTNKYALAPWKEFDLRVTDDGTYRAKKSEVTIPVDTAGLWLVELYDPANPNSRLSRGLIMLESTAVVIKGSAGGELLWVVDSRSGKPVAGADLELFEYWADWESKQNKSIARHKITELKTGADGLAKFTKASNNAQQLITVKTADRYAYSGNGYYWQYYPSGDESGMIGMVFTDRPVYRPLNNVQLRVWARQRVKGEYQEAKNISSLGIAVYNAKNEKIFDKTEQTNGAGGASFELPLKKDAALGMYRIDVIANGSWVAVAGNQFRVEEYKAPELEVAVSVGDGPAKLGAKIPVKISATYFFGGAVEHAKVKYKVYRTDHDATWVAPGPWDWLYGRGYGRSYYAYPWFGWWHEWGPRPWAWYPWWGPQPAAKKELVKEGSGTLDAEGSLAFEIDTAAALRDFGDSDQKYLVEAEVTDASRRTINGEGEVLATKNQFHLHVDTDRGYYEAGNTVRMSVTSLLPSGEPLAVKGEARIAEIAFRGDNGDTIEEAPIEKKALSTGADGKLEYTFDAKKPGQYRLSFVAKDAWGGEVVGTTVVWVWGPSFDGLKFKFNHLEVVTDKRTYRVGETAKLLISSDVAGANILFSPRVDNGHLLAPEVLALNGKTRVVEVPISAAHVPNFFVEATLVAGGKMSEEVRELYVPPPRAELNVSIKPKSAEFRAGQAGELEITTTDPSGKPISADVAVSVFDKAVLYIQSELTPDVRKHFWGRTRTHQVQSQSNLRRRYDNWQYISQPDQQAAYLFTASMNGWMQREVDFMNTDATTAESSLFGSVNEEGVAQGIGGLGLRGDGPGGGGRDEDLQKAGAAKESTKTPASVAAPVTLAEGKLGKSLAGADKAELDDALADGRLSAVAGNKNADPQATVAAVVRRNFADTAMWRAVRTDANGKATLKWTFPDNLTTWRAKVIALDDDTRAGEAATTVVTTKKLLVRLQAPRFFRERDRLVISANVHNRLATEKKVKVELDVTDSLLKIEGEKSRSITVAKNGEQRVDFWVTVHGEGEARVKVSALTDEESDAKELLFPVLVHGFMKTDSAVGSISSKTKDGAEQSLKLRVPAERRMDQGELVVRWSPSLAGAMIDALPYLLDYPYGCTEQTMSRFVPAVLTRRTLQLAGGYSLEDLAKIRSSMNPQQLGGSGDAEYKKRLEREHKRWERSPVYNTALMDDMIAEGLARITKMQRPDGGWGWWGNDRSSIYTTAYVLFGLYEARAADTGVPELLTARGVNAMQSMLPYHLAYYKESEWISDTDAFFAYVMSLYGRSDDTLLKYLFDRRVKLSVYGKSLLALTLWNLGKKDDARLVLRNAEQFLKEDAENETAWVDTRTEGWWYWWNNDIESNAFFLRALVTIKPDDARAPWIVKWLLNHRKNGWYWSSTRDTAIAVSTFAYYMRASKEAETNYDLEVLLDGKVLKKVHIDSKNLLTFEGELRIPSRELPAGDHQLTFRRKGKGAVYFNSYLSYFTLEEDAPPSGLEIKVARNYFKLVRDDRKHEVHNQRGQAVAMTEAAYRKVPMKSGDPLDSGDLILVELMLESKNDYTFLAFEDPKPAGAEAVALKSGATYGEAVANLELRDDRVVFFLSELNQGKLKLEYRLRAEIPGTFHAMPARGFAMYAPELQATSEEMRLTIEEGAEN